jgi:SAM-dependent methyltransferase
MAAAARRAPIESSTIFGDVIARAASYSPARVAETAIRLLDLRRDDAVLELGCGSGRLFSRVAVQVQRGFAFGIDPSPLMVRHARFRNRRFLERGFAGIEVGASDDLARFGEGRFDRVYGLHVVCFWEDPRRDLAEIRRALAPGGRLLLGFCPSEEASAARAPDQARCAIAHVESWLADAGFAAIEGVSEWDGELPLAWLSAQR